MVKRTVLIVLGAVALLIGLPLMIGGGALMAVTGSDETLQSGNQRLSTASTALVTTIDDISHTSGAADALGRPDLRLILSSAQRPTFVGIGPAAEVDRYLAGAGDRAGP